MANKNEFSSLSSNPKIVFMGSPQEAASVLEHLIESDMTPVCVVTNPPARRGRGKAISPTLVEEVALVHGIKVLYDPVELVDFDFDLGVVVAFGKILSDEILELAPFVNIHFSLLPRWRGAAPIERAILAGDEKVGVCLMEIGPGLDEGDIFAQSELILSGDETSQELRETLTEIGAELLVDHLSKGSEGFSQRVTQNGEVTYAKKITSDDLHCDFNLDSEANFKIVRLGEAWTTLKDKRVKIISARPIEIDALDDDDPGTIVDDIVICNPGGLLLLEVQPEGRRVMTASDWLRGVRVGSKKLSFQ
ncbi:methionyl-tRNA formyltransferase [Acidithrix ferrooxidans]|uniref:Methionyl-tRNA formyltransferase n=2 Tax=root TaxID=1 RepID=A0A0D8HHP8_9ACTN|nr:methionyl-tRNA formyltransferase [Acidithrix ferrooxidans]KJF16601.1 methionyl-tRNA formyltransferase [Acidithrix ferrooxidans]